MSNLYLNNIDLQIVSKYIYNFETINNLLLLNNDLKYYYHTTFEIINLPSMYILTDKQVKEIVDKLIKTFPNLNEIILNFNSSESIVYFDDFIDCMLSNYLKFVKYINNIESKKSKSALHPITIGREAPKIKIQFNFKLKHYNCECLLSFQEYQPIFDFKLYILSKMIEQKIILNNIDIIISYSIINKINNNKIKFILQSFNKLKTSKINFIINLRTNMSLDSISDEYKNINGFYFTHYSNGCYKFNNTDDEILLYGDNCLLKLSQQFKLRKYIITFPAYYEIIKLYKNKLNDYKTEHRYINNYVYKFINDNNKKLNRDEKYGNKMNGTVYKCINISNDICFIRKNENYLLYTCDRNAGRWYELQYDILNYFKINNNYEL